ncbi:hypothetical protein BpHYR1_044273 [Brachionus plicatilis]|uniref:Uncharacterized protein n=1 Tax=Brachionus plicatilis TaxID=10195 RepID=A0A3M7PWH0_BRAPC|nr:hypothetical protein BpHYR1_044273 [Brachionus plicatilis]
METAKAHLWARYLLYRISMLYRIYTTTTIYINYFNGFHHGKKRNQEVIKLILCSVCSVS